MTSSETPGGAFALAGNIDANKHLFRAPPIPVNFSGSFNGLGHVISNLEIADLSDDEVGLFAGLSSPGNISGIGVENVRIDGTSYVGGLVGYIAQEATVTNSWASGSVSGSPAGGLTGTNGGTVLNSWSSAEVEGYGGGGGLAGINMGFIEISFATGATGGDEPGGLVGVNYGTITNAYSTGSISATAGSAGGFIGYAFDGSAMTAYSVGRVQYGSPAGGFIGQNGEITAESCYWDKTSNKKLRGVGEGSQVGIARLTRQQFRSGLPNGFDPSIWAQDKKINNGFPYLIANPPAK
jgi:hypothetical protein